MLFALAEGVVIAALLAGGGYLISAAGGQAPEPGEAVKSERVDGGKGRAGLAQRLGGPEFLTGASGLLQVSLQGQKSGADSAKPATPPAAKPAVASPKPAAEPAKPVARALEPAPAPAQTPPREKQPPPPAFQAAAEPKPPATLLLPNVRGRLSDRPDIDVSMSVEMQFENDAALKWELLFKQDVLSAAAGAALRRHEYGRVNTAVLKADMLKTINGQLQSGKLSNVNILDFQIGQAGRDNNVEFK